MFKTLIRYCLVSYFLLIGCTTTSKKLQNPYFYQTKEPRCELNNKEEINWRNIILINKPKVKIKKYTLSFLDLNVREALLELSTQSGIPIVVDENVNGLLSLAISNKSFEEALEMIVSSGPFDYKRNGSYYFVGLVDPTNPGWWKLAYHYNYKVKQIAPSVIMSLINPIYLAYLKADDTHRTLSVVAPKNILVDILTLVSNIDKSQYQVKLNMTITEVYSSARSKVGMFIEGSSAQDALPFTPSIIAGNKLKDYLSSIYTLKSEGKAKIKANPSIIVLEGNKAVFQSKVERIISSGSTSSKPIVKSAGVRMVVIPFVAEDGGITLNIIDATSGDFSDHNKSNDLSEHNFSTTVNVKHGETLILAGMLGKKKRSIITKVPFLGNLPVIGWFFKNETEIVDDVEIVFSIRPEIICE